MHWGGYAERARVKGDWLIKLPAPLSLTRAMAVGTAGFTAMLAIDTLEAAGLTPAAGEVLVTGAAGGVGSVATTLLGQMGYQVVAATGRPETHEYLTELGAAGFIDRAELAEAPSRPLARERFAAAIDNVGGDTLANLLTQVRYGGAVAAVGLAGGSGLKTTVLPFLLRGVSLYVVSALFGLSQGGIVPSYALVVREFFPARDAGTKISLVLMATIFGMALGGWVSGEIYDLTGSYQAAFLNGIVWNLLNMAIAGYLLFDRRRPALAD